MPQNAFEGLELPQFEEGEGASPPRPRGRPPNPKPEPSQPRSTDELDILVEIMGILSPLPLPRRARIVQALVKAYHE